MGNIISLCFLALFPGHSLGAQSLERPNYGGDVQGSCGALANINRSPWPRPEARSLTSASDESVRSFGAQSFIAGQMG